MALPSPALSSPLGQRLVFLLGPPRAGTTLLLRVLHATSSVHGLAEPHVIPTLALASPWYRAERALVDPVQGQRALRGVAARLPGGQAGWLRAARAYTDGVYGGLLEQEGRGRRLLVDKTPANALVLPLLTRLYPDARYLVLTRHPAAIATSQADTFFGGDLALARRHNPLLARYVPPLAALLRRRPVALLHLRYEDLVERPEETLARVSGFLEIAHEPAALDYGRVPGPLGPGDPEGVPRHDRPVADRRDAWAARLAGDPGARAEVAAQVAALDPADLAAWGYPLATLWAPLLAVDPGAGPPPPRRWSVHRVRRAVLLALRRDIRARPHGRLVAAARDLCEVLLREG